MIQNINGFYASKGKEAILMKKNQTIFRVIKNKENPYVMINKQFLDDERLSWKSKGILTYLLSKPDSWQIYETELTKHSTDRLDSLKSGLKELINIGYVRREQIRNRKSTKEDDDIE